VNSYRLKCISLDRCVSCESSAHLPVVPGSTSDEPRSLCSAATLRATSGSPKDLSRLGRPLRLHAPRFESFRLAGAEEGWVWRAQCPRFTNHKAKKNSTSRPSEARAAGAGGAVADAPFALPSAKWPARLESVSIRSMIRAAGRILRWMTWDVRGAADSHVCAGVHKRLTVSPTRLRKISRMSRALILRGNRLRCSASTGLESSSANRIASAIGIKTARATYKSTPARPHTRRTDDTALRGRSVTGRRGGEVSGASCFTCFLEPNRTAETSHHRG
jgi:hypothetical protein